MNWLSVFSLVSSMVYLYLGFQALSKNLRSDTNRVFAGLCLSLALWAFAYSFVYSGSLDNRAEVFSWYRVSSIGWITFPAFILHFGLVLGGAARKFNKTGWYLLLLLIYLPAAVQLYQGLGGNLFIQDFIQTEAGLVEVVDETSFWFYFYNIYLMLYVPVMFAIVYLWGRSSPDHREKKQSRIIVISGLIVLLSGASTNLLLPGLGHEVPALAPIFSIIWAVGIWISIEKYKLMSLHYGVTGELVLAKLLAKLLEAVLQSSGAGRVVIIVEQDGRMLIQGEALAGVATYKLLHRIPLEESHSLPLTILHQAVATREKLLLNDVVKEQVFSRDPYLQRFKPRSLLALPLLLRGVLKGMLYLENSQQSHVFTAERVEALHVLTSQVVVSLQNAIRFASLQESHDHLSEWNRLLEQTVQERTTAVRNLLNNAGQGFLTFGPDLLVDEEYSAECVRIFGRKIEGEKISSLIFHDNEEEQVMLEEIIGQMIEERERCKQKLYLSLLPNEVKLNGCNIQLAFKQLQRRWERENGTEDLLMLILTDITEKRNMEVMMQDEKNILEMVVRIVSNFVDFKATLREYDDFCFHYLQDIDLKQDPLEIYTSVVRSIHTFKGLFHQFGMLSMVTKLHTLETKLQGLQGRKGNELTGKVVLDILEAEKMTEWLEEDLLLLKTMLGDTYFMQENALVIDLESLQEMEERMLKTLTPAQIRLLLPELRKILWKPFRESMKAYPDYIQRLSSQTEKLVYPLDLVGGYFKADLELYRDFIKALLHVFRNALDHGIEPPEERVAAGKDERGKIECSITQDNGWIVVEIRDDGRGISLEKIRETALKARGDKLPQSEEELLQLIFEDKISTQVTVTELSGRGVGLSAVKNEVVKLGGKVEVENRPKRGTTFKFLLPPKRSLINKVSYFEAVRLFFQSARSVLFEQAGLNIQAFTNTCLKAADHVRLLDFTAILPLHGLIPGKIVLTASRKLCSHMLDNYALWEVEEAERENCYDDLLAELLNVITGNFLSRLPEGEFVVCGLLEKMKSGNTYLRNGGKELLTYRLDLEKNGILSFAYLPDTENCLASSQETAGGAGAFLS